MILAGPYSFAFERGPTGLKIHSKPPSPPLNHSLYMQVVCLIQCACISTNLIRTVLKNEQRPDECQSPVVVPRYKCALPRRGKVFPNRVERGLISVSIQTRKASLSPQPPKR